MGDLSADVMLALGCIREHFGYTPPLEISMEEINGLLPYIQSHFQEADHLRTDDKNTAREVMDSALQELGYKQYRYNVRSVYKWNPKV